MKRMIPILLLAFMLPACTPIDLSVSKDGKILIPRAGGFYSFDPATNTAAKLASAKKATFGLYSPSGNGALLYDDGTFYSKIFTQPAMKLKRVSNLTYAAYCAGGKSLVYTNVSGQSDPELKESFAEVHLISGGKDTVLLKRSAKLVRPLPDGTILAIRIDKVNKDEKNHKSYTGKLVKITTAAKVTPICDVTGESAMFLSARADGAKALLICYAAGTYKPVSPNKNGKPVAQCYEIDLATGKATLIGSTQKMNYALYSPDGKHVLLQDDDSLVVANAAFTSRTPLASDGTTSIGGFGPSTDAYPGWYNNNTIYYLRKVSAYGASCTNMHLTLVNIKTKATRDLQPAIEQAIINLGKKK